MQRSENDMQGKSNLETTTVAPRDLTAKDDHVTEADSPQSWKVQNRSSIAAINFEVAQNGLWSDGLRLF
jgi:hypothetical protein